VEFMIFLLVTYWRIIRRLLLRMKSNSPWYSASPLVGISQIIGLDK
jgi:hypothetical protein